MPLKILLVEDNADLRREIQEYLTRRSSTVTAVGSTTEARDFLGCTSSENNQLDVVLCDVNLEDGNGIDLYVEFAPLQPMCRWILMSGDPDPQRLIAARKRAPGLPSCTIMAKPVSLKKLGILAAANPSSQPDKIHATIGTLLDDATSQ